MSRRPPRCQAGSPHTPHPTPHTPHPTPYILNPTLETRTPQPCTRNAKPYSPHQGNILLSHAGGIKLSDFGICARVDPTGAPTTELTQWVGTVTYMSPERIMGDDYSTKADVWSLGVVVAEAVCTPHPTPYTPHPTPHTLQPTPYTRNTEPEPSTRNPTRHTHTHTQTHTHTHTHTHSHTNTHQALGRYPYANEDAAPLEFWDLLHLVPPYLSLCVCVYACVCV